MSEDIFDIKLRLAKIEELLTALLMEVRRDTYTKTPFSVEPGNENPPSSPARHILSEPYTLKAPVD